MKVLSLFSGVGGFDLGLEAAGMETVALCEWDKKAASVLRRHWPHIPIYGDVSDLTATQLLADGVHPDLVAFGSPCQDLSVAGKRAGLAGERSGLFHEALRVIRELRTLTDGALPRWIIWENVVGALSSNNGDDFGAVLDEMGNLGAVFSEWAVLDAQYFGVAQRRRRVFLVSCLDPRAARGCPDPLLPVREGGPRDLVPLREAWKDATGGAPDSARGGRPVVLRQREGKPGGGKGPLLAEQSLTLATENDQTVFQPFTKAGRAQSTEDPETWVAGEVAPTLNLMDNTGDTRATVLGVYGLQGSMIGRQDHNGPQGDGISEDGEPMFTLTVADRHAVATPYAVRRLLPIECERLMGWPDDWTRWDADGKEQADSHRYKQTGNGVASPVAAWVGRHIFAQDAIGRSLK